MEELQSTEAIDREILEDARKKAMRILKACEDTINTQNVEWKKKTAQSVSELEKKYSEQKKIEAEKVMARLPIDKLRIKIEKIEEALRSAVETWYSGLSRAQILDLLSNELAIRLSLCEGFSDSTKKCAEICALDRKEAESILKTVNVSCNIEEIPNAERYPSITLKTDTVRIIASIEKIIDFFLHEKRAELIEALVGCDFMENV